MNKIGFFPDYSESNPYQEELKQALKDKGENVELYNTQKNFKSIVKRENLSILHFHWLTPFIFGENVFTTLRKFIYTTISLLVLKYNGKKIIWTVHNLESHDSKHPLIEKIFKNTCCLLLFNKIIVHCNSSKERVKEKYRASEEQVEVIPHGNFIESYPNDTEKEEAREKLNLPENADIFLSFGQVRRYKGLKDLLESFRQFKYRDKFLVIAGNSNDENLTDEIKSSTEDDEKIRIIDRFIAKEKVQLFFNAADVIVLPYKSITTSGTLILSMSFGKPVIVPRKGCIPEHVNKDSAIFFDSINQLTEKMNQAIESDFKENGDSNFKKAEKMDWEKIAEKTKNLYVN